MDQIEVEYPATKLDDNTVLLTAPQELEWAEDRAAKLVKSALETFSYDSLSSVIPADTTTSQKLTLEWIEQMASGLNSSLENTLSVNAVLLQKILSDGYLGLAYSMIVANIRSNYRMVYAENELAKESPEELRQVKNEVDYFNAAIGLEQLISDALARMYAEGTCPLVLRSEKGKAPVVELYPLSICYPSDYTVSGGRQSILEFDVSQLRSKLQKIYKKTKKNKAVYFQNLEDEVKNNYPKEIYDAYKAGEKYVRMDPRYCAAAKVNDLGRKFGVSPLFRALRPLIVLEQIEAADVSDSKARSKKILFQKLRKEVLGSDGTRLGLDRAAYAHKEAAAALKTSFVLYTAAPFVEELQYVQPKTQSEDSIRQQKEYTEKLLTALGIGFADTDSTVGSAKISVTMLLRVVNAMARSLEGVLNLFYRTWVEDNGHDAKFAPVIKIVNAEEMEPALRKDLASFVYSILNGSRQTAMEYLGIDIDDETARRKKENGDGLDEVFTPRKTAYTSGGDAETDTGPGRPRSSENEEKQAFDEEYTKDVK